MQSLSQPTPGPSGVMSGSGVLEDRQQKEEEAGLVGVQEGIGVVPRIDGSVSRWPSGRPRRRLSAAERMS